MRAFYDQEHQVKLWFDPDRRQLFDRSGRLLGFIEGEGVYDINWCHLALYVSGQILDHRGQTLLVERATGKSKIDPPIVKIEQAEIQTLAAARGRALPGNPSSLLEKLRMASFYARI